MWFANIGQMYIHIHRILNEMKSEYNTQTNFFLRIQNNTVNY